MASQKNNVLLTITQAKEVAEGKKVIWECSDGTFKLVTPKQADAWSKKAATKKATATKTTAKKAVKKASGKKSKAKEVDQLLIDLEPRKDNDGFYIWASYKVCRSAYCYEKQGVKTWKGKVKNKADKANVDFEKQWSKDKARFEKAYKYVKRSDR